MRKFVSWLIAVTLLLSCALGNWTVMAAENEEKNPTIFQNSIKNNDIHYSFSNGVLTVSGTGYADTKYEEICKESDIKEVVIKSGVVGISDYAFSECNNLSKITIPKSVTQIGLWAFVSTDLTEVTIPSTVKKIGNRCFLSCDKLKKITMPGKFKLVLKQPDEEDGEEDDPDLIGPVDEIHFNSSLSLKYIELFCAKKIYTYKNDKKYKSYDGIVYTKNGKKLIWVPTRAKKIKIRKGCTIISAKALALSVNPEVPWEPCCYMTKKITVPATVKKIENDLNDDYRLHHLHGYKWTIKTKKLNGIAVQNLLKMFDKKTKKNFLSSSKFNGRKTKGMYITKDHVLVASTSKAKTVTIPNDVVRIGDEAFSNNKNIKKLVISDKVKEIGDSAFDECRKLSSIKWGKNVKSVGTCAFSFVAVKKIKLPSSVKSWGSSCFGGSKVEKVVFSKTMKKIPDGMFYNTRIKKLIIPGTIKTVGAYAFEGCRKLNKVVFKNGVKTVEENAFYNCGTIDKMIVSKTVKKIKSGSFKYTKVKNLVLKNKNTVIE